MGGTDKGNGDSSLMRNREYRWWFAADTSLQAGALVGGFAFTLLGYTVTRDYTLSGLAGTLNTLVQALMVIPGGAIADRFDRRLLIVGSGACAAVLDVAVVVLLALGWMTTPMLMMVALGSGVLSGLFVNVTDVALPQVVDGSRLAEATAANQSRDALLQLVASPLSGMLYGVSAALPFAVAALLRMVQSLSGAALRTDLRPRRMPADRDGNEPVVADLHGTDDVPPADASSPDGLGEGARWYLRNGDALVVQLLIVVQMMALGMCGMSIVLDQQSMGTPSWMLGGIQSCQGLGMMAGALVMMRVLSRLDGRALFTVTSLMFVACFAATAFTHDPCILAVLGFCASTPLIPLNAMLSTYVALLVPNDLRGRVDAVGTLLVSMASGVASVAAGMLLDRFGYRMAVLLPLAILSIATMAACRTQAIRRMPGLSRMEEIAPVA